MTNDQKTVAIGAASGVTCMAVLVYGLYHLFPSFPLLDTPLARIMFTLAWNAIAVLPLFILIAMVGNGRFFSEAIDPLKHEEGKSMEINGRVVDNTLQQNFVFLIATLALSTFLTADSIKLIPAVTLTYILARIAFWIGYRMHPLYRAPGMAATSYLNLALLLSVIYLFITT